ncbi:MAG: response regulator [bacterium]
MEIRRVLAVDDDSDMQSLITLALEDEFEVLATGDPDEMEDAISFFEPDLVLLDIMLPKTSGFTLLERIRKNPKTSNLPVVVLSAKSDRPDQRCAFRLGANMFLAKPFVAQHLVRNLEAVLNREGKREGGKKRMTLAVAQQSLAVRKNCERHSMHEDEGLLRVAESPAAEEPPAEEPEEQPEKKVARPVPSSRAKKGDEEQESREHWMD